MTVGIGVVAHIDRQSQIKRLRELTEPEIIEVDDGTLGATGNHVATLLALSRLDTDWLLLLEDDALPIPDFRYQASQALEVAPTQIVSFYLGTGYPANWQGRIEAALRADTCWIMCDRLLHGVAYAVRRDVVDSLVARMASLAVARYGTDDAVSKWALEHRILVSSTNPSICDHEDGPSVLTVRYALGHITHGRKRPRHAHRVGIPDHWDDSAVTMSR